MLQTALHEVVEQYPENMALSHKDRELSYRQLWNASSALAHDFLQRGIKAGDRVCLLSENGVEAVIVFWAVIKCNAINVFLNEQSPEASIGQILDDAEPSLIICAGKFRDSRLPATSTCEIVELETLFTDDAYGDSPVDEVAVDDSDPDRIASIIYTSGSTGTPKGVCLTHTNLIGVAGMAGDVYRTVASDSYLMVVPLHYIHGLMVLMTMHLRGAGIHFQNSFVFPVAVVKKIRETGVTGFSGVPFHFTALIERGGLLEADLPNLRWMGVTGGTCPPERLVQIREAQPAIEIHISYGQTECSPRITALDPAKIDTKADSVGEVAKGLTVEFLDDDGEPVAQGELGELVVSGPTVMHGYWNDPENTRRVIDEKGRLHTGDLAYIDEDGDVFIKGRIQAMIKSAGERIFPEELEAILNQATEVVDVAIVGVPDDLYGQRVEAHVMLSEQAASAPEDTVENLRKFCLEHLPLVKVPKSYHFWMEFPLKANGKTDKQTLVKTVSESSHCYSSL